MSRSPRARGERRTPPPGAGAARRAPERAEALPPTHPAFLLAVIAAAFAVLLSVTYVLDEKDMWQHIAVGRALWQLGYVPRTQIWTWPTYGHPGITPSWGFRLLIAPLWDGAGVWGLYGWLWVSTLVVFGLSFGTARRMGARGLGPLLVIVLCALTYRQRAQVRPETLASIWLALTIAVLEWRRRSWTAERTRAAFWRDPALLVAPIAWAWINTHVSFPLGLVVTGAYLIDAAVAGRQGAAGLARAMALSLALVFANPYGANAVMEPLRFFAGQRQEPIFRIIPELLPLDLGRNLPNLLPLVLVGWPLLQIARFARRRGDLAEGLLTVVFVGLAVEAHRFLGFTMVVAAPFLARDLDAWLAPRRVPGPLASPAARAILVAALCLLVPIPEWRRPEFRLGVGIEPRGIPIAACDFMAKQGVRGRGFNPFDLGGYLLHRFWPDRDRLPFMDIHQTGTREDRDLYAYAMTDPEAWRELDRRHHFEWVLLRRLALPGDLYLDHLDADSSFALVFMDDAAALWVRKDGALAGLAARFAYRQLPAGTARLGALGAAALSDPARREAILSELAREAAGSRYDAQALGRMGSLELAAGDLASAESHLRGALASDPQSERAHERLGLIALARGRPRDALEEFERERRLHGSFPRQWLAEGRARQAMGDLDGARADYRRQIAEDPGDAEAQDSLQAIETR